MRSFLLYAVVRLGLWLAIWWLLVQVGVGLALAGVLAALIAMLLSILFLERLRDGAAMRWKDAREARLAARGQEVDEDAEYEDSVLDDGISQGREVTELEPRSDAAPDALPDPEGLEEQEADADAAPGDDGAAPRDGGAAPRDGGATPGDEGAASGNDGAESRGGGAVPGDGGAAPGGAGPAVR